MALWYSGVSFELREIVLRNKPQSMLDISPKGTVPVLQLESEGLDSVSFESEKVLDESVDIMQWALSQNDPDGWLNADIEQAEQLIAENDNEFKDWLDRYKYSDRHPEPELFYREKGEQFLQKLNAQLNKTPFLMGENITWVDNAIFPFIRQFAHVDKEWFYSSDYKALQNWLDHFLHSELFLSIMKKYKPWEEGDNPLLIG